MATATKPRPSRSSPSRIEWSSPVRGDGVDGGVYIPDTAKKPTQGEVIAVGPGRLRRRIPMELKVGDQVIYGKYSGTPYTYEGDEYVIIKASDVLAKLG